MKKTLKKALRTRTVSQEDLGQLLKYINSPENKDNYYLMSDPREDRIGKYHVLVENPLDIENSKKIKLYEKQNDRDIVIYRIRYYDILTEEASDTKKAMQLYVLEKNIEYVYNKELKVHKSTGEFKELSDLLEKVKKAKSYYSFKRFLGDSSSDIIKKKVNK